MMETYYMALGRLTNSFVCGGVPVVEHQNKQHELSIPDFIIWTSLNWNIYNYDELKKAFESRCKESEFKPDFEFDYYLQSLELRGLLKSGKGCTAITALYSLMLDLYIRPINCNLLGRTIVFIGLILRGIPFKTAKLAFGKNEFKSDEEKNVWDITNKTYLSVSEAICCMKNNITEINEDNLIEKIYGEKYDYKTIGAYAQMQDEEYSVLTAIINLYLRKMLIFEM